MLDAAEEQRGYAVLTFTNEGIGEALSGIADGLRCPPRPGSRLDKVVDWLDEIVSAGHRRRFDFEVRIDAREGIEAVAAMRQAARALHAPPPWQRHQRPSPPTQNGRVAPPAVRDFVKGYLAPWT